MLIDVSRRFGVGSIAQVDLDVRTHRNRPLHELAPQARAVLEVGLRRAGIEVRCSGERLRLRRRLEPGAVHARDRAWRHRRAPAGGGGLAPSLSGALAEEGMAPGGRALWVASALSEADRLHATDAAVATGQDSLELRTVAVTPELGRAAYDVISNGTLWFFQHGLFDRSRRPRFDRLWHEAWEAYCQFNEAFADAIAEEAAAGAVVVVNDYHLALVGRYLAKRRPDVATAYFTHTPFCPPEDLAMLPDGPRVELMESMASFGACGFHTARWRDAFLRCASSAGVAAACDVRGPARRRRGEAGRGRRNRSVPVAPRARSTTSWTDAPWCCAATASSCRRT